MKKVDWKILAFLLVFSTIAFNANAYGTVACGDDGWCYDRKSKTLFRDKPRVWLMLASVNVEDPDDRVEVPLPNKTIRF